VIFAFLFSAAFAQDKSSGKGGKGTGKTATKTSPEPSRVYGYISLVDPRTSEKHLILNRDYDPPVVNGFPAWHVVFRNLETNALHRVTFSSGAGLNTYRVPAVAWLYYVPLVQDRSETSPTPRRVERAGYHRYLIRYNPDLWRYSDVEMGPYEYRPAGAALTIRERIPLRRRATPFPEFEDIPEGRDLP
jgi:hypothetical protein